MATMKLLKKGDRFTCTAFNRLMGRVEWTKAVPVVDFSVLEPASPGEGIVTTMPDGQRHDLIYPHDLSNEVFEVSNTSSTGGGYGHGPHDYYPDGHRVAAICPAQGLVVRFYQTGCFTTCVPEDSIKVIT